MNTDIHKPFMDRCLELGMMAMLEGESPVGSVVVRDGQIIGEGYEKSRQLKDVTRHAEVIAILDAGQKNESCEGATLYSNVEPCILCSYVVRHYKIAKVVFSKYCGELGGTNEDMSVLTTDKISKWAEPPVVIVYGDK
jgi:tRNA(adenine34) deaminase